VIHQTAAMMVKGYEYGAYRRRRTGTRAFRTRVLGRRAVCAIGEDAVLALYDPSRFERHGVLPRSVQKTLTGIDAVHTLDGPAHQHRKAMMVANASRDLDDLAAHTAKAWDEAVGRWPSTGNVVLFEEAAEVIMRGACAWAGVPLPESEARSRAADMVAMVDGFATASPRHLQARRARRRSEAWLARLISETRDGWRSDEPETVLGNLAAHRDVDGRPLSPRLCAVELLNLIRPAVAVAWFVMFGGHAMRRTPAARIRLRDGDEAFLAAFIHELRRQYPFAPYVGGRALADVALPDLVVRRGELLLIDVYGHHHDPGLWPDPDRFRPERFDDAAIGAYDLIPQGGGDPHTGHRCPGEPATIALLETLLPRLAGQAHTTPPQDMSISLRRVPARVASGYVLTPSPI
jgi:fatty-acid peroxygenase